MDDPITDELLALLACPKCKSALVRQADRLVCTRPDCRLRYPIREGIPILLIDEAEPPSVLLDGGQAPVQKDTIQPGC